MVGVFTLLMIQQRGEPSRPTKLKGFVRHCKNLQRDVGGLFDINYLGFIILEMKTHHFFVGTCIA